MRVKRFSVEVNDDYRPLLEELSIERETDDLSVALNEALSLLVWARAEVRKGRKIASVDEARRHIQIVNMDALRLGAVPLPTRPALTLVPKGDTH